MKGDPVLDAAIVGGGLAGGLAALALSASGFAVALIDTQDPARMRAEAFDGRTTAIAYASARVFRRLGLWAALEPHAEPIRDILVTDGRAASRFSKGARSAFHLHFDSRELGSGEPLGWIVENRVLRSALFEALAAAPSVKVFAPASVARIDASGGFTEIGLAKGGPLHARLVVAADGKESLLRKSAGIRVRRWAYPQTAIVATVAHAEPHAGVAQEFFLPGGPFAILPMTDAPPGANLKHRSSLVWTERADAAGAYLALDEAGFLEAIARRFGEHLGALALGGPRWSYPLSFHLSERFIAPRLALIGDAARAIHPIAGQGYNLGVKDIAALADVLTRAAGLGLDIGHQSVLEEYQQWRRFDSTMLALGTDALNRLFSNDVAPLRLARDVGMSAVNAAAPLRRFFMRQAGADLGKLPALMAPER